MPEPAATRSASPATDRIIFAKGYGQDKLDNTSSGYQRNDTLELIDILPSEVELTRSGNQLIVSVPSTGDTFTALWQFYNGGSSVYGINHIKFVDGTIWNRATIASNAWVRGTSGNDSIALPSDSVTVDPGAGNDTLSVSGNGSDRIIFAKGYGHDTLNNPDSGYNRWRLSREIGLRRPGDRTGPRVHDFRHRFAIRTLLDWYREGKDVEQQLPVLSTYLGHACVRDTYWYLSACPELMEEAARRLDPRWEVTP
jgi:hypothetical protein